MIAFAERPFPSWGRVDRRPQRVAAPRFQDELAHWFSQSEHRQSSILPVGLRRSYGDSCRNSDGCILDMTGLDRIISFDRSAGVLRAEAGCSLDAILRLIVPEGFFVTTTPGTRFVTLGGAVANDVHGKNHVTAGSFGVGVRRLGLLRSDGGFSDLSALNNPELFAATIGGLGLTGIITWVEIDLVPIKSAYLDFERVAFHNLDEFFSLARDDCGFEHTVAWVDCASDGAKLGRGIYQRARWLSDGCLEAHDSARAHNMPMDAPGWLLNSFTLKGFNTLYFELQRRGARRTRVHYATSFYPLDTILNWNRLYGRRGFYQYQCLLPDVAAEGALKDIFSVITRSGSGSFLAVLKRMGDRLSPGLLSFPAPGFTFAMDFPNKGASTLDVMARLDAIVLEAGGRLYPAKDGRMPGDVFKAGYHKWQDFARHVDPAIQSDFWKRVSS